MAYKILTIDDDTNICDAIKLYLVNEGYEVFVAHDGEEGLKSFEANSPDLILLDIMMPKVNGLQVCRQIRETSNVPIIMLSAKGEVFDKVLGLNLGADDYMEKPFDMKELTARIMVVLRRSQNNIKQNDTDLVKFENIEISLQKYELKIKGEVIELPPRELELLHYLASNYNHVYTRTQLLKNVWNFEFLGDSRTVDVHIKRIRDKVDNVSDKWALKTVWGVGYKFEVYDPN